MKTWERLADIGSVCWYLISAGWARCLLCDRRSFRVTRGFLLCEECFEKLDLPQDAAGFAG